MKKAVLTLWVSVVCLLGLFSGISALIFGIFGYDSEEIYFHPSEIDDWQVEDESITLHGRINYPLGFSASNTYPTVILCHGLGRTLEDHQYLVGQLVQMGIMCFSFDFRGHGLSEGSYPNNRNTTFGDTFGAYRTIMNLEYVDSEHIITFGISMGAGNAMTMALKGLGSAFVVAFPATLYNWGDLPIYKQNITDPGMDGFIMAGTADTCASCLPEYISEFHGNNPNIPLHWFEGATHTDERFWLESMNLTVDWISNFLDVNKPSIVANSTFLIIFGASLSGVTLILLIILFAKNLSHKGRNQKK